LNETILCGREGAAAAGVPSARVKTKAAIPAPIPPGRRLSKPSRIA
jgi:hypothetical protein